MGVYYHIRNVQGLTPSPTYRLDLTALKDAGYRRYRICLFGFRSNISIIHNPNSLKPQDSKVLYPQTPCKPREPKDSTNARCSRERSGKPMVRENKALNCYGLLVIVLMALGPIVPRIFLCDDFGDGA